MSRAIVLWTGGKDSAYALYLAQQSGYVVVSLVTCAPKDPQFRAHPLHVIKAQAESLALPHETITIEEPLKQGYCDALAGLRDQQGIDTVITGDIDLVDGNPNWVKECCDTVGLKTHMPLWHADRKETMKQLVSAGFSMIFSCVKKEFFMPHWVGRAVDAKALEELEVLHREQGVDQCGENGEFHTLVLDGPHFKTPVELAPSVAMSHEQWWYISFKENVVAPDPEQFVRLAYARMPFGKYKDRRLVDLPEDYVVWFSQKGFPKGELGDMLRTVYDIKTNGLEYLFNKIQ